MPLSPGVRVGPYELSAQIGAGGMGEVYRAHDTTLGRDVAIKVLPAAVSSDPDRLSRFEREARLLAALNHPNIATIYGVEHSSDVRALVLELVDGPTLADRITEGPIPLAEAVPIAQQIAEALEAAHEQGIVHRDLKPANIKLRPDGAVKVLDFGLAKLVEGNAGAVHGAGDGFSQSPTISSPAVLTNAGVILGTAAYMAPEQAKGQPADKRSDIWAFGCVLFEMLTGRRAFESRDVTETLAFVLTKEPDWNALPPALPIAIRTLLRHCLERERRKRIGDVAALRFVLDQAANLSTATLPETPIIKQGKATHTVWTIAALVTAIAVVATAAYRFRPASTATSFTFSIVPPEGTTFASASQGGAPALSPDGKRIAFVADGSAGRLLWLQSIDALDARPLPGTEGAVGPFWSPDGAWVGFLAGESLKKVNVIGGQPQVIARAFGAVGSAGTWNQEGTILFYGGSNNTLASASASGGEVAQATERNIALFDENHFNPVFLPDDRHYLLQVRGGPDLQFQVWVGELGSNERRLLLKDVTNARYAPPPAGEPGHLVYVRDRKLMAQPFDLEKLTLAGAAVTIAEGVSGFTTSANGALAYRRTEPRKEELAWYDRTGKQTTILGDRAGDSRNNLRVSPDGKWAAFTRAGDAVQDVWIADLGRGGISRFTFEGGRSPAWSPDGSQLAFLRQDSIYRKPIVGGGAEVALWSGPGIMSLNDWSGDGTYLLLTRWDTSKPALTGRGLWLLPDPLGNAGSREPMLFESDALHGQFGPKTGPARWVSFDAFDGVVRQVFVRTMPGGPQGKWQISSNGGNTSRWRANGRELYVLGGGLMLAVDIDASTSFHASTPRTLFTTPPAFLAAAGQYAHGWDVTPDGRQFLTTLPVPDTPAQAVTVVLNWQSTLIK